MLLPVAITSLDAQKSGLTLANTVLYDASGFKLGGVLSIPHMIVIFVVVLVVFGPSKLPELARGLGKLMADFRKASMDFKFAFEEEMREIERHAREADRKKAAEQAQASAMAALPEPTPPAFEAETIQPPQIAPVSESVARNSEGSEEPPSAPAKSEATEAKIAESKVAESKAAEPEAGPTHDQQQPA